jgi:hypothetical protein
LLAFIVAVFLLAVVQITWLLASHRVQVLDPLKAFLSVGWRLAVAAASAFTAIGVYRRRSWSRWVGLLAILAFGAWSVLRPDTEPYPNEAQEAGAWLARLVLAPILYVWWAYAFSFSKKASEYFGGRGAHEV